MRRSGRTPALPYPLTDILRLRSGQALGSTALTTNSSGGFVARQLYDAWGTVREGGGLPTARNQWIKLSVPASAVGLEGGVVTGWAYTLYDGSIYWDSSGIERNNTTIYPSTSLRAG